MKKYVIVYDFIDVSESEAPSHISSEVRFFFHLSWGLIGTTKPLRSPKKRKAIILSEKKFALDREKFAFQKTAE